MSYLKQLSRKMFRDHLHREFSMSEVSSMYCTFICLNAIHPDIVVSAYLRRDSQDNIFSSCGVYTLSTIGDCLLEFRQGEESKLINTSEYSLI